MPEDILTIKAVAGYLKVSHPSGDVIKVIEAIGLEQGRSLVVDQHPHGGLSILKVAVPFIELSRQD